MTRRGASGLPGQVAGTDVAIVCNMEILCFGMLGWGKDGWGVSQHSVVL